MASLDKEQYLVDHPHSAWVDEYHIPRGLHG